MEVDLPVWTIRPNWSQGILERLEWMTDVLTSDTGVEQRRSVRMSPRRSFEITVNPTRNDRTYLDLVLHRLGSEEWLFPLWHDQAVLTVDYVANAASIYIDNTFREFETGGYAVLYRSTFEWDVVKINAQFDNRVSMAMGERSAKTWPKGTKLYPLRVCTVQTDTSLKALTSRVGESQILFQVNAANDYPEMAGGAMLEYARSPLLALAPNRVQEITTDHVRLFDEQDGDIGLRYRTDTVGRSFAVQSHNWQITGREAHADFRSFLYTLRGRQRMVWLPTFNDDLFVAQPVALGATQANIEACGMRFVGSGSPIPGRARLWTGKEVMNIASIPAPLVAGEERLGLTAPTSFAYAPGASWSFLEPARLDQDSIELHHHTDSDGTMECAAGFHTFNNARDASGSNFLPIPVSALTPGECGAPLGLNPCRYVPFNGIYLSVVFHVQPSPGGNGVVGDPCHDGDRYIDIPPQKPYGGIQVDQYHFFGGGCHPSPLVQNFYEHNNPELDPRWQGQLLARYTELNYNSWKWEYFFPVIGGVHVHMYTSTRYLGDGGSAGTDGFVTVTKRGEAPILLGPVAVAGATDSDWGTM